MLQLAVKPPVALLYIYWQLGARGDLLPFPHHQVRLGTLPCYCLSTAIIINMGDTTLTATQGRKMSANGMLSLFTGLGPNPNVISQQRLCLVYNKCAMFYMPLLIFPRSTLTSQSKDNWQFMTPLFHLMSQRGGFQATAWPWPRHTRVCVCVCSHICSCKHTHTRHSFNILRTVDKWHSSVPI